MWPSNRRNIRRHGAGVGLGLAVVHRYLTLTFHRSCQIGFERLSSRVMITIEGISEVAQDQTLTIELPKSITPGPHRVVVVIEETPLGHAGRQPAEPLHLTKLRLEAWPKDSTFRREDLYGDSGR